MSDQSSTTSTDAPAEVFSDVAFPTQPAAEPPADDVMDLTPGMEAGPTAGMPPGASDAPASETTLAGTAGSDAAGAAMAAVVAATTSGDTAASGDGASTTTVAAAAGGQGGAGAAGFKLSENVGLSTAVYRRETALPSDRALVRLLVPDNRTVKLWHAIDELAGDVEGLRRGSQELVSEMIDRLTVARNLLLHSRDSYEDAEREVAIVRHRLLRVQHSTFLEQPQTIVGYLVIVLLILGAGFFFSNAVLDFFGRPGTIAGISAPVLLNTMLWGGIGGLSAAFFALQRHVLDFDQQHARWYYLSPVIGLFIGPLIALVAEIGLPALFVLAGGQTANMTVAPALLYLLAWAVGFQQNLLLRLVNKVFTSIMPDKAEA
jgi:hypothetical protein